MDDRTTGQPTQPALHDTRLPQARPSAVSGDVRPGLEREAILAQRAERLAVRPDLGTLRDYHRSGDVALVFALGVERYAFPSTQIREVRAFGALTALPGTPAFVAGLLNLRGRIVPVLDLRPLFGLSTADPAQTVLILAGPHGDAGLLATDRPTVRFLKGTGLGDDMGPLPGGAPPGLHADFVRGVTPDMVVVLDAERLLVNERLLVQHSP